MSIQDRDKIFVILNIFPKTIIKRIVCIIGLFFGVDVKIIAEKTNLSLKSIRKYELIFKSDNYADITKPIPSNKKSELENYKGEILAELGKKPYKTLREIAVMIEKLTGLKRSRVRIREFLKKRISSSQSRFFAR
jgi:transposase